MPERALINLYSTRILALAADIPHLGRLDMPGATAYRRSPQCGSSITVDLDLTDGRVSAFAQDVKACALGQAAASVVGARIIGRSPDEIRSARDALRNMLTEGGPAPSTPFEELAVLQPAAEFKNRHASILLCLEAASDALDQIEKPACA